MMRKGTRNMEMLDSSSDDEAPEEVSVTSSKTERLAQLKSIQEADRKKKDEEKLRRRQRNEMFHLQKVEKLEELSKRKLPEDVLEGIPAKSSRINKSQIDSNKVSETDAFGVREDDKESETSSNKEDEGFNEGNPDFVPLGPSNLAVVTDNQVSKLRLSSYQQALDFKNRNLYNQKKIPRQTTQERRAREAKKKALQQR